MPFELPSLTALRAFEAAARHKSIKLGAQELHVTPGAISQHIKGLEEELGGALFTRRTRSIELTDAGRALAAELTDSFQRLSHTVDGLFAHDLTDVLTVSVLPSFAAKWLVPKLGRFRERHPGIDVRVSSSNHLVDFAVEQVDIAVRSGLGVYPGLRSDFLLSGHCLPVCSPELLAGPIPLREPPDLHRHTLLHSEPSDWPKWLKAFNVAGIDAHRGPQFSDDGLLLDAAIDGQGVAVSREVLVAADLSRGLLVAPFGRLTVHDEDFYVVSPEVFAQRPKIVAFRDWIMDEVRLADEAAQASIAII